MKNIGFIGAIVLAMILTAVVTRRCGNVYTDTYPTKAEQTQAAERGDTIMSGYDKKTGEATVADTTRASVFACGSRVNGGDWPVGVVGLLVAVSGLFFLNRKPKVPPPETGVGYPITPEPKPDPTRPWERKQP